jgi:hypothetical protein
MLYDNHAPCLRSLLGLLTGRETRQIAYRGTSSPCQGALALLFLGASAILSTKPVIPALPGELFSNSIIGELPFCGEVC